MYNFIMHVQDWYIMFVLNGFAYIDSFKVGICKWLVFYAEFLEVREMEYII